MKYCSRCGTAMAEDSGFCPQCGAAQGTVRTKYCAKCGTAMDIAAEICPKCGCQVAEKESSAWGILSLIFGLLGGWIGLVFGVIGLKQCKKKANRNLCMGGIVCFCAWVIVYVVLFTLAMIRIWSYLPKVA